ncbi:MAG TPA: hypothetical protein VF452_22625 [Candidatus Binatia bacterium]
MVKEPLRAAAQARDHLAAPEAVLVVVEVPVAEPAAIRVQTATVRDPAAVPAQAWGAASAVGQVLVLLRVVAPEVGRAVVQALRVDRAAVSGEPEMAPAADLALVQVVALREVSAVGQVVARALVPVEALDFQGDREVVPVVRASALREARQGDRAKEVVQRGMAVALQEVQAVAQPGVEAGAAPVAGQGAARVALVVARVGVVLGVAQATVVSGPAIMANGV